MQGYTDGNCRQNTISGLLIYQPLFRAMKVPRASMQDACSYMKIICCGTVFVFGYNAVCSIMKGFGDSGSPLFFIAVATAVNILLDVFFVGMFGMGTAGAAWATIFSQAISLFVSIVHLKRKNFVFDFNGMGFPGIYIGQAVSPILPAIVGLVYFKSRVWESKQLIHHRV